MLPVAREAFWWDTLVQPPGPPGLAEGGLLRKVESMPQTTLDEERLFRACAASRNLAEARRLAEGDASSPPQPAVQALFTALEIMEGLAPTEFLRHYLDWCAHAPAPHYAQPLFWYWRRQRDRFTLDDIEALARAVDAGLLEDHPGRQLVPLARSHARLRRGELGPARAEAEETVALTTRQGGILGDYLSARLYEVLSLCHEAEGDLRKARDQMRIAHEIASVNDFACRWDFLVRYGELLEDRGHFGEALALYQGEVSQRLAAGDPRRGVFLALSAARAATQMEDVELAYREVVACDERLRELGSLADPLQSAELLLVSGLVEHLLENREESTDLLHAAIKAYHELDPPGLEGALRAWQALTESTFPQREQVDLLAREIERLIGQSRADPPGPRIAEGLAVLESYLYTTDDPPEVARYREAFQRLAMVRRPLLRFRALANLYFFALQFLDNYDQAVLLLRLKNLSRELDAGTYRRIYERLVSSRYQYAIEGRLARYAARQPQE